MLVMSAPGDGESGQLGTGNTVSVTTPAAVKAIPAVAAWASIYASEEHTCALAISGAAYCFGIQDRGRLGVVPQAKVLYLSSPQPVVTVAGVESWAGIAMGAFHR